MEHTLLNQGDIECAIQDELGIPAKQVKALVNELRVLIGNVAHRNYTVKVPLIGIFEPAHKAARQGMNFKTNQPMIISARTKIKYNPSEFIRNSLKAGESA